MAIQDTISRFINLETLFTSNDYFEIPPYQRDYSWKKGNIEQFWKDFKEVLEEKKSYFIGAMYLSRENAPQNAFPEPTKMTVIDGQQRLTSLTLFLITFRDIIIEKRHSTALTTQESEEIDELLSEINRLIKKGTEFKLKLNNVNEEFFIEYQKRPSERNLEIPNRASNKQIKYAYDCFKRKVESEIENSDLKFYKLIKLYFETLIKAYHVEVVILIDIEDAPTIFETINQRSLELSTADLFKNHLFKIANKLEYENIQRKWDDIFLQYKDSDLSIPDFLRNYWLSRYGVTSDKKLFSELKDKTNNMNLEEFRRFITEIEEDANIYFYLHSVDDGDYTTDAKTNLHDIKALKYRSCIPLLISGNSTLENETFARLTELVLKFLFKYVTVSEKSTSDINNMFSKWAIELRSDQNFEDIKRKVVSYTNISDEEFKINTNKFSSSTPNPFKYYLKCIVKNTQVTQELQLPENLDDIHLEHILPIKHQRYWPEIESELGLEKLTELKFNVGNTTLLKNRLNQSISNKKFEDKKEKYEESDLEMTKALIEFEDWNEEAINTRAEEFSESALEIWNLNNI